MTCTLSQTARTRLGKREVHVVQIDMKKKLIIAACLLVVVLTALYTAFLYGITHAVIRETEGTLAINVAYCNWIDSGNIDRLTNSLNMALISQLNALDSLDRNRLHFGGWYLLNARKSSVGAGERWNHIRGFAEARVKTQRDEFNYLMTNPEEAVRRLEQALTKSLREKGWSNVNVSVSGDITIPSRPSPITPDQETITTCVRNMRIIASAKAQTARAHDLNDGDSVSRDDVSTYIRNGIDSLSCPASGRYHTKLIGEDPNCSIHGALTEATRTMIQND